MLLVIDAFVKQLSNTTKTPKKETLMQQKKTNLDMELKTGYFPEPSYSVIS